MPKPSSPEFERMKSLVGTWSGKCDMGQGPIEMTVLSALAPGTVLEERVFAGTERDGHVYYDQGGKLALTHYAGQSSGMFSRSSDSKASSSISTKLAGSIRRRIAHAL